MSSSATERYARAEQAVSDLIERLPKETIAQIARSLAQNIAHYRLQTGIDIPLEDTMLLFNNPTRLGLNDETLTTLKAEAMVELASILAWQAGESALIMHKDGPLH